MDYLELIAKLKSLCGSYNPFIICAFLNIDIRYVPFLDNPRGQFQEILNRKVIFLSNSLMESPERFYVCAHELGHALLHEGISNYYVLNRTTRSKMESEADRFATNILLSCHKEDTGSYPRKFEHLQTAYGVPLKSERYLLD
ncbi:ImmA/IrrE family metallo-endopeptidase [Enterococcus sp. LJL90]